MDHAWHPRNKVTSKTLRWALAFAPDVVALQELGEDHHSAWRTGIRRPIEPPMSAPAATSVG
jgi:hypothetical protein